MFCRNCGKELKDGAGFCPGCGAKMPGGNAQAGKETKITGESSDAMPSLKRPSATELPGKGGMNKKLLLAVGAAVAAVVVIILTVFMLQPKIEDIDTEKLLGVYLQEHTEYSNNQEQYQKCFRYLISDMTEQMEQTFTPTLEKFFINADLSSQFFNWMENNLIEQYSTQENQVAAVEGILAYSDYEVGEAKKDGDVVSADVVISFKNITQINEGFINDMSTDMKDMLMERIKELVPKILAIVGQAATGGQAGAIAATADIGLDVVGGVVEDADKIASIDMPFLLEKYFEQASIESNDTYTGKVEFEYNKDTKEWEISHVDQGLLDAYYGIR